MAINHAYPETAGSQSTAAKPKIAPKEEMEIVKESKEEFKSATFYCMRGELSFALPEYERDGFGEVVKDAHDRPKKLRVTDQDGNNAHDVFESFKFDRLPVIDPKSNKTSALIFHGIFIISPEFPIRWRRKEELVDYLNLVRKNKHSYVLNEDEYRLQRNPEQFAAEKELMTVKLTNEELRKRNEKLEATLREKGV